MLSLLVTHSSTSLVVTRTPVDLTLIELPDLRAAPALCTYDELPYHRAGSSAAAIFRSVSAGAAATALSNAPLSLGTRTTATGEAAAAAEVGTQQATEGLPQEGVDATEVVA